SWDNRRNISYFEFSQEFLNGSLDPFPLIASVKSPTSNLPIWGNRETKLYSKLPPFLADSLPDSWGNQVFECWRIENNIRNQDITPLDILSFIGKRGMGALEFFPESSGFKKSEKLNLKALTDLAHRIFHERENLKFLPEESLDMQSLITVGTSAGGRQPKAIIAIKHSTGEIRSGQIAGLKGFDYCILKFGDPQRSSAELEMAYYEMAKTAGIDMSPCNLIEIDGKKHFITQRFDRNNDRKIHMQTLAALYPDADSYEQLLMVCRKMRIPQSSQQEIFRRMVFNILANNTDDHNKNFSFLMDEKGNWRLSPAYDMTFIFNRGGFLPETQHCLMMRGKLDGQTKDDALTIAKENGIRKADAIINEVAAAISNFHNYAEKYGAANEWIGRIETCLNQHLSDWDFLKMKATKIRIEQVYKGNYHLIAEIDGKERKFVIGKNKEDYNLIQQIGINNLTEEQLQAMVKKFLTSNN
ncbi:MAG: type II toxin-antitoxin system HipA family toxin, partial [Prevotella sp.]|nr:type II toxin-antitoxin system HipA family toxin [Prevotella sp.]